MANFGFIQYMLMPIVMIYMIVRNNWLLVFSVAATEVFLVAFCFIMLRRSWAKFNKMKDELVANSKTTRKALLERGIIPEELPPQKDLKLIEKQRKEERKLGHKNTLKTIKRSSD